MSKNGADNGDSTSTENIEETPDAGAYATAANNSGEHFAVIERRLHAMFGKKDKQTTPEKN